MKLGVIHELKRRQALISLEHYVSSVMDRHKKGTQVVKSFHQSEFRKETIAQSENWKETCRSPLDGLWIDSNLRCMLRLGGT